MKKNIGKFIVLGALASAAIGMASTASAQISVGIGVPGPVYVAPAPVVYGPRPVAMGWYGDRYYDGHRYWHRDEWNRYHGGHRHFDDRRWR